jgi:hypothetical protein
MRRHGTACQLCKWDGAGARTARATPPYKKSSGMNAKDRRPLVNSGPWVIPPDLLADNDANPVDEQHKQRIFSAELALSFVYLM